MSSPKSESRADNQLVKKVNYKLFIVAQVICIQVAPILSFMFMISLFTGFLICFFYMFWFPIWWQIAPVPLSKNTQVHNNRQNPNTYAQWDISNLIKLYSELLLIKNLTLVIFLHTNCMTWQITRKAFTSQRMPFCHRDVCYLTSHQWM